MVCQSKVFGHKGLTKFWELPVEKDVNVMPIMAPTAAIFVTPNSTCNFPLRFTPKRLILVNSQIVMRAMKKVTIRLKGVPDVISHIAFKYSVNTRATATIDAVSDTKNVYHGVDGRHHGLRYNDVDDGEILGVLYNDTLLGQLRSLFDDFIVLSAFESFYLGSTGIHRDYASEVKQVKIMLYLDDVTEVSKGPLYMIPGSQNMYDKCRRSISLVTLII